MLEEDIRKAMLTDLKRNHIFLDRYVQRTPIILDAYSRGIVSDEDIESALHDLAIESGRKAYTMCTKNPGEFQPDHFLPEQLAYALAFGAISLRAASKLRFDHGGTLHSFIKEFLPQGPKVYLQKLRENILGQDKTCEEDTWGMTAQSIDDYLKESETYYDPHPACCHH